MTHNPSPLPFPASDPDAEQHAASPTAHLLDELALYGYRPTRPQPKHPDMVLLQAGRQRAPSAPPPAGPTIAPEPALVRQP